MLMISDTGDQRMMEEIKKKEESMGTIYYARRSDEFVSDDTSI